MAKALKATIPLWERYSPQMKRVHQRLSNQGKGGLQPFLQREVPKRGVETVAQELHVHWTTLYRWIDLLFVRGKGPHLIPIADVQAAEAAERAEAEKVEQAQAAAALRELATGTEG